MELTKCQAGILQELIECNENRVYGPRLASLSRKIGEENVFRAVDILLLVVHTYCVPEVARTLLSQVKGDVRTVGLLHRLFTEISTLSEVFDLSENPDIFRPDIGPEERELFQKYVQEHWHPVTSIGLGLPINGTNS